jgi:hypothetical protein
LWKVPERNWPALQIVGATVFGRWLTTPDDFRNWLIREAA